MKIIVAGLGAIGSNLLLELARTHQNLSFIGLDYDKVEERNLKTQIYFLDHISMPKAKAAGIVLNRYHRTVKYTPIDFKIDHPSQIGKFIQLNTEDLVLDCFDNTASRKITCDLKANILHIGFSPQYTAEIIWNENYSVPNDVQGLDICELSEACSFIHFTASLSSMVITDFLEKGIKNNFIITNKWQIKKL